MINTVAKYFYFANKPSTKQRIQKRTHNHIFHGENLFAYHVTIKKNQKGKRTYNRLAERWHRLHSTQYFRLESVCHLPEYDAHPIQSKKTVINSNFLKFFIQNIFNCSFGWKNFHFV